MKTVLYIGQYSEGTTSKMRADILNKILSPSHFQIIDTHVPFFRTNKIFRSLGFRYKVGPLIRSVNTFIKKHLSDDHYDLIWMDKGVFIEPKTMALLRERTGKLIHFTPDPAFIYHQSKWFNQSIPYYDFLITTKSFELGIYSEKAPKAKVICLTQGFDKALHQKSEKNFSEKAGLLFIGHHEEHRERVLQRLLDNQVPISLAGIKWEQFSKKNQNNKELNYLGSGIYGEDYVRAIQKAKIAWGALSKWIPELHTTRSFEIPACGTALLTEKNKETETFFREDEVLFYVTVDELVDKVVYYLNEPQLLEEISQRGYQRVMNDGYDYESILRKALKRITP